MQGLINGPGCSADGTKAANPLGRVVDQFLGMGGSGANGRMVGPRGPGAGGPQGLRQGMQQHMMAQQMRGQMEPRTTPQLPLNQASVVWLAEWDGMLMVI